MNPVRTSEHNRMCGALLGLAVGDAIGTTVEFKPRGSFDPVTDMVGGGPFDLEPGQWTDDTSMALCLANSLMEKKEFDAFDQMEKYYRWWTEGYMSVKDHCFDIGNATSAALARFESSQDPFSGSIDPNRSGNGSLMRLAPVPIFFYPDMEKIIHYSGESSRTTHASKHCIDCCQLFGWLLGQAIAGKDNKDFLFEFPNKLQTPEVQGIADGHYRHLDRDSVFGTGFAVESLEAALWCFWTTNNFEEAVLMAVNLGDDADTTGAICGQIAGAYYGRTGIPPQWADKVYNARNILMTVDVIAGAHAFC